VAQKLASENVSPEERLFQVIKGDAVGSSRPVGANGCSPLQKNKKYYLFTVLFLIMAFFPGYYFSNRNAGANNHLPLPIVPISINKENKNIVRAQKFVPLHSDPMSSESMQPEELIKNLNLVGIAWEDEPHAMIENKISGKTFFVKKGEFLYQLKVEKIMVDKIVLNCKGEKFELM